jgi:hypothetical protein
MSLLYNIFIIFLNIMVGQNPKKGENMVKKVRGAKVNVFF